jgi:hypothetical protein
MSLSQAYPTVRPALLLDFARAQTLDPRITFTRATPAVRYDGVTTAVAEQNLLLQSQSLATGSWTVVGLTQANNVTTAPDGTATATRITETAVNSEHYNAQTLNPFAGGVFVYSVYLKKGTLATAPDWVQLANGGTASGYLSINLATGALGNNSGYTATITSVGSGWYRISISTSVAAGAISFRIGFTNNTNAATRHVTYTGSTTSDVLVWGAQVEQRATLTAYTVTTTQAITNYIPVLQTVAAGVARFDFDPVTDVSLGLLIEEQRTNLVTYSEQFDNAYWTKTNLSVTANAVVAPDGTLTADSLVENTAAGGHNIKSTAFNSGSLTSGISYTFSVYVKPAGRNWAILEMQGSLGGGYAWFDLSTGTLGTQTQLSGTSTINAVGNGWYRVSITDTSTGTGSTVSTCNVYATTDNNVVSYTGDGFSGISVWGAQLEAGAFVTSYIATVATAQTRNADVAVMTGTNFSSWFNNGQGTIYAEGMRPSLLGNDAVIAAVSNGTANNTIELYKTGNGSTVSICYVAVNGVFTAGPALNNVYTAGQFAKSTVCYQIDNYQLAANGTLGTADTSSAVPVCDQFGIGSRAGGLQWNGYIRKIAYYDTRLPNAQLQALTVS